MENKEYRFFNIECRMTDTTSAVLEGKAISFDTDSNDLGFIESISPNAITQDLLNRSDIVLNVNHNNDNVLGRSFNGAGTLKLERRDDGVYFSCDLPNTQLGRDVYQQVQRGDLRSCSFAFSVPKDEDAQKWSKRDGQIYRRINKIDMIRDISIVTFPAYNDTAVMARSMEEFEAAKAMFEEDEKREQETETDTETTEVVEETDVVEENVEETPKNEEILDTAENAELNTQSATDTDVVEQPNEQTTTDVEDSTELPNEVEQKRNIENKKMEKRFSFVRAINSIANNKPMDSIDAAVCAKGADEMRASGLTYGGQIQLPVSELRGEISVSTEGEDLVATELFDVMTPLRAKNVLVQAGAKVLSGLQGNVEIPVMHGGNVTWEGETADAKDASIGFDNVVLSPHRLTAYVEVSKQLLIQSSDDVEAIIREDLINAINDKLEATILGDTSVAGQPEGLFYDAEYVASATTLAKVAEVEEAVEEANVLGECKWIVSPNFKATLRAKSKGENTASNVWYNGEIDGTEALVTSHVKKGDAIYGDFSNLAIGHWSGIDVTVDPYSQAKNAKVVLVVNAYFDAKPLRKAAFKCAKVGA